MKIRKILNRRDFIEMTVAGSSALFTQSCRNWGASQITPESVTTAQRKVRVRYCITSPDATAQRNVAYLRKSIAKMKNLSKTSPNSKFGWIAQAEIHRKYCSRDHNNIHNTGLFLPWHRAYLFFFEEICRQILKEDNVVDYADFALPYWDWTKSPNIPNVFGKTVWDEDLNTIKPPDNWITDPNFKWERLIEPRGQIPGDLGIGYILNEPSFYYIIGVDSFSDFSGGILLSGPHSTIHAGIGGNMREPGLAALDPIFWLHHANVDRIWSKWMENHPGGVPSPNCPPEGCGIDCRYPPLITKWLKSTAEGFYDVSEKPTGRQVLNLLDTFKPEYLGYCYDDGKPIMWSDCPRLQTTNLPGFSIKSNVIGQIAKVDKLKAVRVGDFLTPTFKNKKILENLDASVIEILQTQITLNSSSPSPSLLLILEVEKPANPAISVRVFINAPPDQSKLSIDSPSYVATFSFFESTIESHQHNSDNKSMNLESRAFVFNITDTILKLYKLNDSKPFSLQDMKISIFPKLLNDKSSNGTEYIKLISFRFDLAK
jgi:hypothetical protein